MARQLLEPGYAGSHHRAGVAGLSAAIALRRAGVEDLVIIERSSAVAAQSGTGVAIPPNGARALQRLGLPIHRLVASGTRLRAYQFRTSTGRLVTEADLTRLWLGESEPYFAVHRQRLHEELLQGLGAQAIRFNTTAVLPPSAELEADRPIGVRIRGSGGGGAAEESRHFDLVVGADGIHSAVRHALRPEVVARPLGWWTWRCVVEYPDATPETQVAFSGRGGVFLHIPLDAGKVYVYAAVRQRPDRRPSQAGYGADLLRHIEGFRIDRTLLDALRDLPDHAYHTGMLEEVAHEQLGDIPGSRVVLIGDALHGCSPNMAQGVALAVEDACVLAELARKVASCRDDSCNDGCHGSATSRRRRASAIRSSTSGPTARCSRVSPTSS
jgi:2-polyprenyl-6-methoxyphenol hydroxylase-like FAD-dependent oxidoreductase